MKSSLTSNLLDFTQCKTIIFIRQEFVILTNYDPHIIHYFLNHLKYTNFHYKILKCMHDNAY